MGVVVNEEEWARHCAMRDTTGHPADPRNSERLCKPHGRPYAWPHAVGCTECCRLAAEDADPGMAPNGGFWA